MNNLYQQMLMSFLNKSPMMDQIHKEMKETGLSAEKLFYKKAQEMGIDPQTILSQIK